MLTTNVIPQNWDVCMSRCRFAFWLSWWELKSHRGVRKFKTKESPHRSSKRQVSGFCWKISSYNSCRSKNIVPWISLLGLCNPPADQMPVLVRDDTIMDLSPGVQDYLIGDDLDVTRLKSLGQVEFWVFSNGSKGPAHLVMSMLQPVRLP